MKMSLHRKIGFIVFLFILNSVFVYSAQALKNKEEAKNIGSRLELFVDDWLIDKMANLEFKLHSPTPREIVFNFDKPWEGIYSGYVTIIKEDGYYRMYYNGGNNSITDGEKPVTCYAESNDGINWARPNLGLYDFMGSKENNIIWRGPESINFAPFKDKNPSALNSQRYKAIGGIPPVALVSSDGIHWKKMREEPIITKGTFDSLNTAFFDELQKEYVCYFRDNHCLGKDDNEVYKYYLENCYKDIRISKSKDFIQWTKPEWLNYSDEPYEHLESHSIVPYFRAPHIYLGFPLRYVPKKTIVRGESFFAITDSVFMSSRDGLNWKRFMEAFIRPDLDKTNFVEPNFMVKWGIISTSSEEISLYYGEHYWYSTARLRRATIRTDGFVSINASYNGGEFITKPFIFRGKELAANYSTSAAGIIQVELLNTEGKLIKKSEEIFGNEIEGIILKDIGKFSGKPVRLRFILKDADLYSIRFK